MAWTEATVTLPSVRFAKEECGQKISKMEQFMQCSYVHCVQTGMFQCG